MLSKTKKRILIYFEEKDLQKIDKLAKKENRSRVNYIVNVVLHEINKTTPDRDFTSRSGVVVAPTNSDKKII